MRTYSQDCWIKYARRSDTQNDLTSQTCELSYDAGRKAAELWLLTGEPPWLLDINRLYRFTYHDTCSYSGPGLAIERHDHNHTLVLSDPDHIVVLSLDELRTFLAAVFREPPLQVRHPLVATVTLAGEDIERQIDVCLNFDSDSAADIILDFGAEYDSWECGRDTLIAALEEESADGQLIIGPIRYQRLPIVVHTENGQPEYTVELESSEVEYFLVEVLRLVPDGEERRYDPDRFDQELARLLIEGTRQESDEPPSTEPQA